MLTWEGTPILGDELIAEKLTVSSCIPEDANFTQPTRLY